MLTLKTIFCPMNVIFLVCLIQCPIWAWQRQIIPTIALGFIAFGMYAVSFMGNFEHIYGIYKAERESRLKKKAKLIEKELAELSTGAK